MIVIFLHATVAILSLIEKTTYNSQTQILLHKKTESNYNDKGSVRMWNILHKLPSYI
jgi:capsular polysaccharide biosynthesis protein